MENLGKLRSTAGQLLPKLLELRDLKPCPIVLIDGRAGSGKSTLAALLTNLVFKETRQSPKVIHMDDLYPGWDGLENGSLYLVQQILKSIRMDGKADWQVWDWVDSMRGGKDPGNGWRSFTGQNLLIVEGCGSVTQQSIDLADLSIWAESDIETRKERFLARHKGKFAEHWATWSTQEDVFYQNERSRELCEIEISN